MSEPARRDRPARDDEATLHVDADAAVGDRADDAARGEPLGPSAILGLQRCVGNTAVSRMVSQRSSRARVLRAPPTGPQAFVPIGPEAERVLASLGLDRAQVESFGRGEVVQFIRGEYDVVGFLELKPTYVRAGIDNIVMPGDPDGATQRFFEFRSAAAKLTRALGLDEMELVGGHVRDARVKETLTKRGFTPTDDPAPGSLSKRFRVATGGPGPAQGQSPTSGGTPGGTSPAGEAGGAAASQPETPHVPTRPQATDAPGPGGARQAAGAPSARLRAGVRLGVGIGIDVALVFLAAWSERAKFRELYAEKIQPELQGRLAAAQPLIAEHIAENRWRQLYAVVAIGIHEMDGVIRDIGLAGFEISFAATDEQDHSSVVFSIPLNDEADESAAGALEAARSGLSMQACLEHSHMAGAERDRFVAGYLKATGAEPDLTRQHAAALAYREQLRSAEAAEKQEPAGAQALGIGDVLEKLERQDPRLGPR